MSLLASTGKDVNFFALFSGNRCLNLSARVVLFILQGGYIAHLFSDNIERVNSACAVGSHFILNNLYHFAFVMLFVRSLFGWAELILILNFINLSSLYFRHNGYARFIHEPVVSGPLAWTFVAIYWNGAIMVPNSQTLVARIFGNIFIWSILVYGLFFIVAYKVGILPAGMFGLTDLCRTIRWASTFRFSRLLSAFPNSSCRSLHYSGSLHLP